MLCFVPTKTQVTHKMYSYVRFDINKYRIVPAREIVIIFKKKLDLLLQRRCNKMQYINRRDLAARGNKGDN